MNPSAPDLLLNTPAAPVGAASEAWRLFILAVDEPLLLSRVLQKIIVPEIGLRAARYEAGAAETDVRVELTLVGRPERADLVAARLRKIIGVHTITLDRAE